MTLLEHIKDLTERVRNNLKNINGNLYLDVYLEDEFFHLVNDNWYNLKNEAIAPSYLELQKIIIDDIFLKIIVDNKSGNLYNSMMTYNASCTEEDLHYFYNIPYGGEGELEHLCTHTGYGNNVSDLDAGKVLTLMAIDSFENPGYVDVGPKFEVKDYKDLESAKSHIQKDAETSKFHDSVHVFVHIVDTNDYYITANKKATKFYKLAGTSQIKHHRQQVKLWLNDDGFLGVKFR